MPRIEAAIGTGTLLAASAFSLAADAPSKPSTNVILCMADDFGWGSVGYNGAKDVKTPNIDAMAAEGIRFDRFYAAAPVCSPTRFSCLTGRHPHRSGIFTANRGILRPEETTIAELLRKRGYATGHFGKWHLGTLSKTEKDSNRGGSEHPEFYNPPSMHGFDTFFSTEAKIPTWDPMKMPKVFGKGESRKYGWRYISSKTPSVPYGSFYWTPQAKVSSEKLNGNDSKLIMDRTIAFIEKNSAESKPFLAVVWFHATHLPVVAGPKYAETYKNLPFKEQQYYGAITAMDDQIGRLRKKLDELGISKNTMLWFTSDNGPEKNTPGSAGKLRERKRSLHDGGIRVPGILVWPAVVKKPMVVETPVSTCDYLPTILAALRIPLPKNASVLDGTNIMPLIEGKKFERSTPMCFVFGAQAACVGPRYKYYQASPQAEPELYDMLSDPGEANNIADQHPEVVANFQKRFDVWLDSCKNSFLGKEYGTASFDKLKQTWPGRSGKKGKRRKKKR